MRQELLRTADRLDDPRPVSPGRHVHTSLKPFDGAEIARIERHAPRGRQGPAGVLEYPVEFLVHGPYGSPSHAQNRRGTYGSKAFEEGLRHVIERSVRFNAGASRAVAAMAQCHAVANLYAPPEEPQAPDPEVEQAIKTALTRKPSPYDSHPSPSERTRWVRALNAPGTVSSVEDARPAWTLFADPVAIQTEMTEAVRQMIQRG